MWSRLLRLRAVVCGFCGFLLPRSHMVGDACAVWVVASFSLHASSLTSVVATLEEWHLPSFSTLHHFIAD